MRARVATSEDLAFVSGDGHVPPDVVARKIAHGEVYVCERAGEPVGYLRLGSIWSTHPLIDLILIHEPHRRRGAGKALLALVEHDLRMSGHTHLFSSSQENEPEPQRWHRHMGFVDCGVLHGLNEDGSG